MNHVCVDIHELTPPVVSRVHMNLHREGRVFRLVIVDDNHIPARERHLGGESDLRLGGNQENGNQQKDEEVSSSWEILPLHVLLSSELDGSWTLVQVFSCDT